MSVTEVHQAMGRWNLTLDESTPRSVREAIGLLGHVIITGTRLDLSALTDPKDIYPHEDLHPSDDLYPNMPILQQSSRYTGVVLHVGTGDDRGLSGYGLAWWMGQESEGPIIERPFILNGGTAEALRKLLPPGLFPGTSYTAAQNFAGTVESLQTYRDALNYVMTHMGNEWRVNADGTVDAGPAESLFGSDPQAVAVRNGGWDVDIDTLDVTSLGMDSDAEDWVSDVLLIGRGRDSEHVSAKASRSTPYTDFWGNQARRTALVQDSRSEESSAGRDAQTALFSRDETRRAVSLSARDFQIDGDLTTGATIDVYDPESGIYDLTNAREWRGQTIWPLEVRVLSITWPVTDSMGVYYVNGTDRIDLTDHVETSRGDTTFDVGAKPRSLTRLEAVREAMRGRMRGGPLYIGDRL